MQATEAVVEKGLEGTGLTVRTRAVLEIIYKHGSLPVPSIASHLYIQRQYVQVMVNETLAENFTTKIANPRHKSSSLIALTDTGRQLIESAMSRELETISALATDFSAEDIKRALQLTTTLVQRLNEVKQGENL